MLLGSESCVLVAKKLHTYAVLYELNIGLVIQPFSIAFLKDIIKVIGGECSPFHPQNNGDSLSIDCLIDLALYVINSFKCLVNFWSI